MTDKVMFDHKMRDYGQDWSYLVMVGKISKTNQI